MTFDELYSLVIRLANVINMRYWKYWNYPHEPQTFAIGFYKKHDHYGSIGKHLEEKGFELTADDDGYVFYTIVRTHQTQ